MKAEKESKSLIAKISRLEELILSFEKSITNKISNVENRLSKLGDRMFRVEQKLDDLDKRTASYPKLYDNVDKILGEIIENRQERTFMNNRLINHEDRIVKLEHLAA